MSLFTKIYVHLPASELEARLPLFLDLGWNPEIALQVNDLDTCSYADYARVCSHLQNRGLSSCIHAPFFDLNPASGDPDIAAITRHRFFQTLDAAAALGATHIVFHPGYDPWRYARAPESWLSHSLAFWPELLTRAEAHGIILCLENIFDTQPRPLLDLLQQLDSPWLQHCFDIGHWFLFSETPLAEWLDPFAPYLHHLHLHDNRGRQDDHRPIGSGRIDFTDFIARLRERDLHPTATLEAHRQQDAEKSFAALRALLDA